VQLGYETAIKVALMIRITPAGSRPYEQIMNLPKLRRNSPLIALISIEFNRFRNQ